MPTNRQLIAVAADDVSHEPLRANSVYTRLPDRAGILAELASVFHGFHGDGGSVGLEISGSVGRFVCIDHGYFTHILVTPPPELASVER